MTKYFFFGDVLTGGADKRRITTGKGFKVEGGNEKDHKDTVEIVRLVEEGVRMDGIHHVKEIVSDAVKKVKG